MSKGMSWVDEHEKKSEEERSSGYFKIVEGDNRIQVLSHAAQLTQVFEGGKYRPAEEGDKNISIKGLCWVLQDGIIKEAKLPYTVVKAIREYQNDPDYAFEDFPMPRLINIKAKNAGTKEVEYNVIASPKETEVSKEILEELKKKPSPEEVVQKIKDKFSQANKSVDYPEDNIDPDSIPF